jgi:hypothetical protein
MTRSAGPVSAAESLMWRLRADLARTTGYVRLCPNSDIDRYDHLPEAAASMKRQALLRILTWLGGAAYMTTPTTIIGQARIAALSIRRAY